MFQQYRETSYSLVDLSKPLELRQPHGHQNELRESDKAVSYIVSVDFECYE
jgi:hypothetical protein